MLLVPKLHLGTHSVFEAALRVLLSLPEETKYNFVHRHRSQVQLGNERASGNARHG